MNRPTTIHNLAESTTFADENLVRRRAAAFGAAQRHSRRVMLLRRVLPAAVTGAVVLTIAWMWLDPLRFTRDIPVQMGKLSISGTKLNMDAPKLTGFSKDGRPYTVTAESAAQDLKTPGIIELSNIVGQFDSGARGNTVLNAKSGVYNYKAEQMRIFDGVDFRSTAGHSGQLSDATIETRKGHLVSENPVDFFFKEGSLHGNRFEVFEHGSVLVFEGGVTMILRPEPTATGSTPKEAAQ
jgi:lipopolysaccharide export system protein LptC